MTVDGKVKVKKRIKVFENNKFITYLYIFENGNSYKETVSKWKQKDFETSICETPEEKIEKQLDKIVYRR